MNNNLDYKELYKEYYELWWNAQQDSTELLQHLLRLLWDFKDDPTHIYYEMNKTQKWLEDMNWWREPNYE